MGKQLFTSTQIRTATLKDLKFVDDLQKKHAKCVSFLPAVALEKYITQGKVKLASENGDPCGYFLGNERLTYEPRIRPIFQTAIAFDAQRRAHGMALVELAGRSALDNGQMVLQANCREGLEANEFWLAAGFQPIAKIYHFASRGRWLICWRKALTPSEPRWMRRLPPIAGGHAMRTREIE